MAHPGFLKAKALFKKAARDISAYRSFLNARHIKPASIKTFEDFQGIPPMDKQNYLYRHDFKNLFAGRKMPPMVYASSGSSGHPTFWFRGDEQEKTGAMIHEKIFSEIFNIPKNEETLVIVCFSMGVWIAGNFTYMACRELSRAGHHISVVTPGIDMGDIMEVMKRVAPKFQHVILAGYPPFVMDVINEAKRSKVAIPENIRFITAGDKFTEAWRVSLLELIHAKDPLRAIVSIYGSADAGVLGYETPLSIFLRQTAMGGNQELRKILFGESVNEPALVQYDPEVIFFEESKGELLFTTNTAAPLIRYNIHDVGRVISFDEMKEILKERDLLKTAQQKKLLKWNLPFIVKDGRNDVAVTFYALNIYPENIKSGLDDRKIKKFISGQFFAFNRNANHNKKQELCVNVELAQGINPKEKIRKELQVSIVDTLVKQNIEYRKLHSIFGKRAWPRINLVPFGTKHFYSVGIRGILGVNGKKLKILDIKKA